MSITRILKTDEIRPREVVFVILVCAVVAGSCLLTSGPTTSFLSDGAVDWGANSWLRSVVGVLDLNYSQTTAQGIAVKSFVFGMGAALALVLLGGSLLIRSPSGEELTADDHVVTESAKDAIAVPKTLARAQIDPRLGAQVLAGMLLVYSAIGTQWAQSPELALGGTLLLATGLAWAFALGSGLKPRSASVCGSGIVVALAITALMAIWYHHERNPTLRASYPVGNPLFLAACLLPGLLLAGALIAAALRLLCSPRRCTRCRATMDTSALSCPQCGSAVALKSPGRLWAVVAGAGAATVAIAWAFYLAGGRGPLVGLVAGVGVGATLLLPKRPRRYAGLLIAVAGVGLLGWFYSQSTNALPTGRDATIRMRFYAWDYALDLIARKPLLGHGQGGFVALGDSLAAADVEFDPLALNARVTHTHNEWLELLTDLGSIGTVLWLAALGLTMVAGIRAMDRARTVWVRYVLAGLLASLAGLAVEETFGVGLRVAGLPTVFYTLIGLTWAMSAPPTVRGAASLIPARIGRPIAVVVCLGGALVLARFNYHDFRGARAGYEFPLSMARLDWDAAVSQARTARQSRLNPQRRLVAMEQLSAVHLNIARYHFESFRQRMARAEQDESGSRRETLARKDLKRAADHQRRGMNALGYLYRAAPGYWNANRLWGEFSLLHAELLAAEGDTDNANQQHANAVAALRQELQRRPFNLELTARLVEVAGPGIPPSDLVTILSRPLRVNSLSPAYVQLVLQSAQWPGMTEAIDDLARTIRTFAPPAVPDEWTTPWAPEVLRIHALLRFQTFEYAAAEDALEIAVDLYGKLPLRSLLATAHALAELADCRFFAHPEMPQRAIESAERALIDCPDSQPGRALRAVVRARMLRYRLAAGQEDAVRAALRAEFPEVAAELIELEIGARYANICFSFRHRDAAEFPPMYERWVERAAELNPNYELVWRLKADIAFQDGRDADAVEHLRRALQQGADPNLIIAFVQVGLSKRPDSQPFLELHAELLPEFQNPPATTDATPPAVPVPNEPLILANPPALEPEGDSRLGPPPEETDSRIAPGEDAP